jgi:tetratricopeptide (TPR) repeat protein
MSENDRIARATRLYALLLRLYPKRHRDVFGAQMVQTFRDHYRATAAEHGGLMIRFWVGVMIDEARGIARERSVALRVLLIMLAIMGAAVMCPRPLIVLALALLLGVSLLPRFVKLWRTQWRIAAVILLAVGLLGLVGVRNAVQAAQTNTWCTRSHKTASQPPTALTTAADYFAQGDYDYDRGDCTAAIGDYTMAITLNPTYAEAYNNRAYTAMMRGQYADALPDLDRAIQLRPDYAHALMNRGDIYNYYYAIDRARAIADYDRVIALGPGAMRDTSVCGHRLLATHNGWNLRTILDLPRAGC